jgi:hypothetical protein
VGIRGGITNLDFSGATAAHIDMVYGVGVTLKDGTTVIGDLYHSGYSIVIGTDGKVGVEKTPPEWSAAFQTAMTGHGSGGSVSGTKVAGLGGTNKTSDGPGANDQGTQSNDVASNGPGTVATWGDIAANPDLAGVGAEYDGTYTATVTDEGGLVTSEFSSPNPADYKFALKYQFADRTGTAYFAEPEEPNNIFTDPALKMSVAADSLAGLGPASFSGNHTTMGTAENMGGTPTQSDVGYVYGQINGFFLNTPSGLGTGVAGTFDAHVFDGGPGHEDGDYHMVGAFGGNYTPPPP